MSARRSVTSDPRASGPRAQSTMPSELFVTSLDDSYDMYRPIPIMPSPLFCNLAQSQMELLSFSVDRIKAMALYLPQENSETGQLEFLPAIFYPHSERVFIANDANSGEAPMLPRTLTRLPGFEHASSLLPAYPMVSNGDAGVGSVEEVMCDPITKTSALSIPMFQGSQTVGVLLVWSKAAKKGKSTWSPSDKAQISRAAQSLSMALSMDSERKILQKQSESLQTQLSDALHQVKNPIQALRTYGKLLQRKLADAEGSLNDQLGTSSSPQLLELAQHLMVQSDRVVDLMSPFDTIVNSLPSAPAPRTPLALNPYQAPDVGPQHLALTPWQNASAVRNNGNSFLQPRTVVSAAPATGKQRERGPKNTMDFVQRRERLSSNNNNTLEFGTTKVTSGVGYSNGTLDFSRNSRGAPGKRLDSAGVTMRTDGLPEVNEALEMGFVMDILEPILDAGRALASERGIDFEIIAAPDLPGVWTRPKALQQAVSNVLDNALKYVVLGSDSRSRVVVQARRHAPEPGVVISISDNGPGIASEEVYAVFQRGHRGMRTRAIDGSGIGLDISRSMLARMGGELRLRETSSRGTTFEIVLYRNAQ